PWSTCPRPVSKKKPQTKKTGRGPARAKPGDTVYSAEPDGKKGRNFRPKAAARVKRPVMREQASFVDLKEYGRQARNRPKRRRRGRNRRQLAHVQAAPGKQRETLPETIQIDETVTVEELAVKIGMKSSDLILRLMDEDLMATKNQVLGVTLAKQLAEEKDFKVRIVSDEAELQLVEQYEDREEDLEARPPIITVMGHVDHGKTCLLDKIRESEVAEGEHGGITQHIGAYNVRLEKGNVVFLDTPGHEAFTAMRARGAQVTDLVILVVAADDGVMPQTLEAIDHAKAAEVPIIVAVNKMDLPDANKDRVLQQLAQRGLTPEDWGGHTVVCPVSAHTGEGIKDMLDMLLLEAELLELQANPSRPAQGVVIEAELDRGRGSVATILIQVGTLRVGDIFIAGGDCGKVRALHTDHDENVKAVGPGTPVEVVGFHGVPEVGEKFVVYSDERKARQIAESRAAKTRLRATALRRPVSLEDLHLQIEQDGVAHLNVILKGDVQGSVEAVRESLLRLNHDEVQIKVIHEGVGGINESDIILASASEALILGFNVVANIRAAKLAEEEGVELKLYRIIYKLLEDITAAMEGMLKPEYREVVTARLDVRDIFKISAIGTIAGCYVTQGTISRADQARLTRNDVIIHEGPLASLRRFKDDVRSVQQNFECGIRFEGYDDVKVEDRIESYQMEAIERKLGD
ncbi:translation initiation factor IF-2, partial [Candidatus Hydrogenedentota bacterium]